MPLHTQWPLDQVHSVDSWSNRLWVSNHMEMLKPLLLCMHIPLSFLNVILFNVTLYGLLWMFLCKHEVQTRKRDALQSHTVLALYCIGADSSHIWKWESAGDFETHGLHPTWGYLAQQNNLWALESGKMTHLKCTCPSVYVQTHLAMININFQAALDKSAPPTSEAVIREKVEIFLRRHHLCWKQAG